MNTYEQVLLPGGPWQTGSWPWRRMTATDGRSFLTPRSLSRWHLPLRVRVPRDSFTPPW